ncbi:MAG: methylated-DNA--[Clostridia bacterium]|nr:methylated-DNA--[protein]-cysteine S-methyltransferase [Clostridia bacterium]
MILSTWLGSIRVTIGDEGVTGLWFTDCPPHNCPVSEEKEAVLEQPLFRQTADWLNEYLSGAKPQNCPPVCLHTTPFRRMVYRKILEIPYGETRTYGEIAAALSAETGRTVSARAVGGAAGHNPVLLLIPCHRVIGAGGSLTGYAGGIERKQKLLKLESHKSI